MSAHGDMRSSIPGRGTNSPVSRIPVDAALEASWEELERVCPPTEPLLPLPVRIWFLLRNFPALPSPAFPLAMGLSIPITGGTGGYFPPLTCRRVYIYRGDTGLLSSHPPVGRCPAVPPPSPEGHQHGSTICSPRHPEFSCTSVTSVPADPVASLIAASPPSDGSDRIYQAEEHGDAEDAWNRAGNATLPG